jgi:hypothetical protein
VTFSCASVTSEPSVSLAVLALVLAVGERLIFRLLALSSNTSKRNRLDVERS